MTLKQFVTSILLMGWKQIEKNQNGTFRLFILADCNKFIEINTIKPYVNSSSYITNTWTDNYTYTVVIRSRNMNVPVIIPAATSNPKCFSLNAALREVSSWT